MNLLADAHISRGMTEYLAGLGHDLVHAALLQPRISDEALLKLAHAQQRVILTADKDFGALVFRRMLPCAGVVLVRLTPASEAERLKIFQRFWPLVQATVAGHFVVMSDNAVRRTPLPVQLY